MSINKTCGHSLVSGGLYALVEAAWASGEDLPRHVEPWGGRA